MMIFPIKVARILRNPPTFISLLFLLDIIGLIAFTALAHFFPQWLIGGWTDSLADDSNPPMEVHKALVAGIVMLPLLTLSAAVLGAALARVMDRRPENKGYGGATACLIALVLLPKQIYSTIVLVAYVSVMLSLFDIFGPASILKPNRMLLHIVSGLISQVVPVSCFVALVLSQKFPGFSALQGRGLQQPKAKKRGTAVKALAPLFLPALLAAGILLALQLIFFFEDIVFYGYRPNVEAMLTILSQIALLNPDVDVSYTAQLCATIFAFGLAWEALRCVRPAGLDPNREGKK